MAVLGLLPDSCTRPSSARPKRVTRKDRGTGGTKKHNRRQHNRRVSAKICPVQISTPTRLDKTGPLATLGLPGSRDGTISSCARGVSNGSTSRARVSIFFSLSSMAWETNAINYLALPIVAKSKNDSKLQFNSVSTYKRRVRGIS